MKTKTHLNDLTQCVRESKRPIAILLGAGCGKALQDDQGEPLVPDTRGLTVEVGNLIADTEASESWMSILDQVGSHENDDCPPNIEDVLSHVRGLLNFAGDGEVRGLNAEQLRTLEATICESITAIVAKDLPSSQTPYHRVAQWLSSIDRSEPVELFTTNYDLLIEQALEELRVPYFDGFVGSHRPYFDAYAVTQDTLPSRWTRLWKIHGSVNWVTATEDGQRRVWRSDTSRGERAVIHPSNMKYDESRKMPYLAMMERLQSFVSKPDSVLLVVGYSFGDEHLNDVLLQSLQGTPTAALFALMYGQIGAYDEARRLAKRQSNFTLLARDGGIVGSNRVYWHTRSESPNGDLETVGVQWNESDEGEHREVFTLGDFNIFGEFLRQVIGPSTATGDE